MVEIIDMSPTPGIPPLEGKGVLQGFPEYHTIVRGKATHAELTMFFIRRKNEELAAAGKPELSEEEKRRLMYHSVRMFVDDGEVRIVVEDLSEALAIDRQLQTVLPADRITFLDEARQLLRAGLCWRCTAPVKTFADKVMAIKHTKRPLSSGLIVFHSPFKGTRYITCDEVGAIKKTINDRRVFLERISELYTLLHTRNRKGLPELYFFMGKPRYKLSSLMALAGDFDRTVADWAPGEKEKAARLFDDFHTALCDSVKPLYHGESYEITSWVNHMYELLSTSVSGPPTWEKSMSSEFWHSISWMPGARVEDEKLIFDGDVNEIVHGLIKAYWKRFKGLPLEYINIGVLNKSLRTAVPFETEIDRWVGVVILKYQGQDQQIYLVRKEKWGVLGRLMRGETDDISLAQEKAKEYTDYIALRMIGLRMLNISVPDFERIDCSFHLTAPGQPEIMVEESFWQRPYIEGVASDKISLKSYGTPGFTSRLATMMGYLAGKNIAIGRADGLGNVRFDDGDEIVVLDNTERPEKVVVADCPGSFFAYKEPLTVQIPEYREVLDRMTAKSREGGIPEAELAEIETNFLTGFERGYRELRNHYLVNKERLDSMFTQNREQDGHFHCRWHAILKRLEATTPEALVEALANYTL
ncbi:MAG: hypothetical protein RRC34_03325 [Lentisphaeria bacterium]|nr:hypothetical protein [Lentisphaeria bacterium]